jgi:hypothetical protein
MERQMTDRKLEEAMRKITGGRKESWVRDVATRFLIKFIIAMLIGSILIFLGS